jgi:hypothetical protein
MTLNDLVDATFKSLEDIFAMVVFIYSLPIELIVILGLSTQYI